MTALGSWAWCSRSQGGVWATGYVARRPNGTVSTAVAEITTLTFAAEASGEDVTFIIDKLGTASRAKAILTDRFGDKLADVAALVTEAERAEMMDEVGFGWDPADANHGDPLEDDEIHGRPQQLLGPMAARGRLIPARDGALWRRFEAAAEQPGARWKV